MSLLSINNLSKRFGKTAVLHDISFSVQAGEIFGFLGPNGAGKSTTLRCIMDFVRPTSGSIILLDKDSHSYAADLKKEIGYVPAEPNLYADWTVNEHLAFVASLQKTDMAKAERLKRLLKLDGHKAVRQLSTGNQQKLAIILALVRRPKLLLLDEPTRGLDPLLRATLHDLLREYSRDGGTVLLSSHDLAEVEELCTNLAIIRAGRLVSDTSVEKLREASVHKVSVVFASAFPNLSSCSTIVDLSVSGLVASFTVKGDMSPVLHLIGKSEVRDIEIARASLEDVFLKIYT